MIIKSVQIEFCQQNLSLFCEFFYSQNIPTANKYMKFFKDEKNILPALCLTKNSV